VQTSAYHPGFGQTIRYQFDWLPEDPDGQVAVSIRRMNRLILEDACSPLILQRAGMALQLGQGDPITGVWRTVKPLLRFRQDADIARDLQVDDPRLQDVVEVFIRPVDQELLIRQMGQGFEDCDGFELYAAALLTALGVQTELVTVSADPREPHRYSHVYLAAYQEGRRIPLDFSHGPYPGWECKNLGRRREWPLEDSEDWTVAWLLLGLGAAAYWLHSKGKRAA